MDVNIALQIMPKRLQCLFLSSLRQADINHLTLHHQAFVFGDAFCDPTRLERLVGSSGIQGRFALGYDLFFCDPTGLERLAGSSGTQGRFALLCDIDFCEPTGLLRLAGSSGT